MPLTAGAASVNITPPVGVDMSGFGNRPSPSIGVHDDLYAKALALSDGGTTLVLVTTDLISLDMDLVGQIRRQIQQRWQIPGEQVMLNSSHTHSGPATISLRGLGERDEPYVGMLVRKIVGSVQMALQQMQPARLGWGRAPVQVGINRRRKREDGAMQIGVNPGGAIAAYVDVLRVEGVESGKTTALMFSHAAHPVVLDGSNVFLSADFPGYAASFIEQDQGCIAMFAQGCCGDINAHPRDGSFEAAERLGTILGRATVACAEQIETADIATLRAVSAVTRLPFMEPMSVDESRKLVEHYKQSLDEVRVQRTGRPQSYLAKGSLAWAQAMHRAATGQHRPESQPFETQVFQVGQVALVGMPGEVFVDYALRLDEESPFAQNVVLGYTNGCVGYVPTARAYPEGGYEVTNAYQYYGTLMIGPESEDLICSTALNLMQQLHGRSG